MGRFLAHHILAVVALVGRAARSIAVVRRKIALHRRIMQRTCFAACVGAGLFTLLPGRYLGDLLWHHGLGLM